MRYFIYIGYAKVILLSFRSTGEVFVFNFMHGIDQSLSSSKTLATTCTTTYMCHCDSVHQCISVLFLGLICTVLRSEADDYLPVSSIITYRVYLKLLGRREDSRDSIKK